MSSNVIQLDSRRKKQNLTGSLSIESSVIPFRRFRIEEFGATIFSSTSLDEVITYANENKCSGKIEQLFTIKTHNSMRPAWIEIQL